MKKIIVLLMILFMIPIVFGGISTKISNAISTFNITNATRMTIIDSGTNISYYHVNTTNVYASYYYLNGIELILWMMSRFVNNSWTNYTMDTELQNTNNSLKGIMLNRTNVGGENITLDDNGKLAMNISCETITGGAGLCDGVDATSTFDPNDLDVVNTTMLQNSTIIRKGNTSWITSNQNYFVPSTIDYVNHTQLNNNTIVRSYNITWVDTLVSTWITGNITMLRVDIANNVSMLRTDINNNITMVNNSVKTWVYNGTLMLNSDLNTYFLSNNSLVNASVKLWVYNGTLPVNGMVTSWISGNVTMLRTDISNNVSMLRTDINNNITMVNNSVKTWVYNGSLQSTLINSSNITCIGNQCFYNGSAGGTFTGGDVANLINAQGGINTTNLNATNLLVTSSNTVINSSGVYINNSKVTKQTEITICQNGWGSNDCDYVTDGISDETEINNAATFLYNNNKQGSTIYLRGNDFNISSQIKLKYGTKLRGIAGTTDAGTHFTYKTVTRLFWTGISGGVMMNVSGYIDNWGLSDLVFDGNYTAGVGLYKFNDGNGNRARNLKLEYLTFAHINGTSIDMGNQIDDTTLLNVNIFEGCNGSIGIKSPNSMINMVGGRIANQDIGVLFDANTSSTGQSIQFTGVVFGSNQNDLIVNTSRGYLNTISLDGCWIEPGSVLHKNFLKVLQPTQIQSISLNGCTIGSDGLTESFMNLTLTNYSYISINGGRSYNPNNAKIYGNEYTYIDFNNHNFDGYRYSLVNIPEEKSSTDSLKGYWKLNSNTYDSSENYNDGSVRGTTNYAFGLFGSSFYFDGSSKINTTDIDLQNFTISAWIYPTEITGDNYIVSKSDLSSYLNGAYVMYLFANKLAILTVIGNGVANQTIFTSSITLSANRWYHVTTTKYNDKIRLYVDGRDAGCIYGAGALFSCDNFTGDWRLNDNSVLTSIGGSSGTILYNGFNGSIDEVVIWNRGMSAREIRSLYDSNKELFSDNNYATNNISSPTKITYSNGAVIDNKVSSILNITGANLTIQNKLSFALGGSLDNIVTNWIRVNGHFNVTGNTTLMNNLSLPSFPTCNLETDANGWLVCGTDDASAFVPSTIDYVNHTQLNNNTIIRSYNITWVDTLVSTWISGNVTMLRTDISNNITLTNTNIGNNYTFLNNRDNAINATGNIGYLINNTKHLNVSILSAYNTTYGTMGIWFNGSGICIGNC